MKEQFKIPETVTMPILKREANIQNARWILRNVAINNPQEKAIQAKAAVKDWLAKNSFDPHSFFEF